MQISGNASQLKPPPMEVTFPGSDRQTEVPFEYEVSPRTTDSPRLELESTLPDAPASSAEGSFDRGFDDGSSNRRQRQAPDQLIPPPPKPPSTPLSSRPIETNKPIASTNSPTKSILQPQMDRLTSSPIVAPIEVDTPAKHEGPAVDKQLFERLNPPTQPNVSTDIPNGLSLETAPVLPAYEPNLQSEVQSQVSQTVPLEGATNSRETDEIVEETQPVPFVASPRPNRNRSEVTVKSVGTRIMLEMFEALEPNSVDEKYGLPLGDDVKFEPLPALKTDAETSSTTEPPESGTTMLVVYRDNDGRVFLAPPARHVPDDKNRIAPIIPIGKPDGVEGKTEYYQPPITMLRLKATTPVEKPVTKASIGSIQMRDMNFVEGSHLLKQRPVSVQQAPQVARPATPVKPYMLQSAVKRLMPQPAPSIRR